MIEKALLTVTMTILSVIGVQAVYNQITKISDKIHTVARSASNPLVNVVPCAKSGAESGCYSPTK